MFPQELNKNTIKDITNNVNTNSPRFHIKITQRTTICESTSSEFKELTKKNIQKFPKNSDIRNTLITNKARTECNYSTNEMDLPIKTQRKNSMMSVNKYEKKVNVFELTKNGYNSTPISETQESMDDEIYNEVNNIVEDKLYCEDPKIKYEVTKNDIDECNNSEKEEVEDLKAKDVIERNTNDNIEPKTDPKKEIKLKNDLKNCSKFSKNINVKDPSKKRIKHFRRNKIKYNDKNSTYIEHKSVAKQIIDENPEFDEETSNPKTIRNGSEGIIIHDSSKLIMRKSSIFGGNDEALDDLIMKPRQKDHQIITLIFAIFTSILLLIMSHEKINYFDKTTKSVLLKLSKLLVGSHSFFQCFMRQFSFKTILYVGLNIISFGLVIGNFIYNSNFLLNHSLGWATASYGPMCLLIRWEKYDSNRRLGLGLIILSSLLLIIIGDCGYNPELVYTLSAWLECSSGLFSFIFEVQSTKKAYLCMLLIVSLSFLFIGSADIIPKIYKSPLLGFSTWMISGYGIGRYIKLKDERIRSIIMHVLPISLLLHGVGIYYIINDNNVQGRWWRQLGSWMLSSLSVCTIGIKITTNIIL